MRTVHKYPVHFLNESFTLKLPFGAEFVHVGVAPDGRASVWFDLETDRPSQDRKFRVHGTGHDIGIGNHLGSWVWDQFVWHLYEKFE